MTLDPHGVLLFQGDSITDAGRRRLTSTPNSPDGMGVGYPRLIMEQIFNRYPDRELRFYNRGVSGDRIQDMVSRWQRDTLSLQPNLISVLIGVNDTWNYLSMGLATSPERYHKIYHQLLENTRAKLPEVALVLCEPFLLITGEVTGEWEQDLVQRQGAVQELAEKFGAIRVPFQSALNTAVAEGVPAVRLLDDGVHPTQWGHRVLADCWIESVLGD
jgi:lysophospholipase L1-like esterase